jgi:hypothetical protein
MAIYEPVIGIDLLKSAIFACFWLSLQLSPTTVVQDKGAETREWGAGGAIVHKQE